MIGKILLTLAVAVVALYGYRLLKQFSNVSAPKNEGSPRADAKITADMAKCGICGTYVPRDAPSACERPECPYAPGSSGD